MDMMKMVFLAKSCVKSLRDIFLVYHLENHCLIGLPLSWMVNGVMPVGNTLRSTTRIFFMSKIRREISLKRLAGEKKI